MLIVRACRYFNNLTRARPGRSSDTGQRSSDSQFGRRCASSLGAAVGVAAIFADIGSGRGGCNIERRGGARTRIVTTLECLGAHRDAIRQNHGAGIQAG